MSSWVDRCMGLVAIDTVSWVGKCRGWTLKV